jgi:hypothetical protein
MIFVEKFIVVRGRINDGKTTTCGFLFQELRKDARYSGIFDHSFHEMNELKYGEAGDLRDFIGIVILNGKLIISQGDVAKDLEKLLGKLEDLLIIAGIKKSIDVIVCCARSRNVPNSTIAMLRKRTDEANIFEFWTKWSENPDDKLVVKKRVVEEIIGKIGTL